MPEGSPASHAALTGPALQDGGIQSIRFGPERIRQSIADRDGIAAATFHLNDHPAVSATCHILRARH